MKQHPMMSIDQMVDEMNRRGHTTDYRGANGHHLIVGARTRDSGHMEQSNFAVAERRLRLVHDKAVGVECFSHWAVGWIEYLTIDPNASAALVDEAREIVCALNEYPILDDEDYTQRLHDAAWSSAENLLSSLRSDDIWRADAEQVFDEYGYDLEGGATARQLDLLAERYEQEDERGEALEDERQEMLRAAQAGAWMACPLCHVVRDSDRIRLTTEHALACTCCIAEGRATEATIYDDDNHNQEV